ncbi:MAG: phosphoribosylglycinamide formyltransferase [archaeon]
MKIGVLASTRGTDLQAIIDEIEAGSLDAEISCVISNKESAGALDKARAHSIDAIFIDPDDKSREEFDEEIAAELGKRGVELVLLIGYMRILSPSFVRKYENRIMNAHPSLLPAFAGGMDTNVHREVLESGVKETGCTIHFVTEDVDSGPIILQKKVLVEKNDTEETLKAKVQEQEKIAFIEAINLFKDGKLKIEGSTVTILK